MRRSLSWTDPERLEEALARAGAPARTSGGPPAGRRPRRGVERPGGSLAVAAARGLLRREPGAPDTVQTPPEAIGAPGVRLEERLRRFLDWLKEARRARAAFVLDADGLPLSRSEAPDDLLAVAPFLLSSVERARSLLEFPLAASVSLSVSLDGDRQLRLDSVASPVGRIAVGTVGPPAGGPVAPGHLSELLSTLFSEEE
ncbi:MAG: hypothetical protein ACLF0P_17005 [Thermoanaerobaculia bacterium]